jgi:hypothetical protein
VAIAVVGTLLVFLSYEENQEAAAVPPIANKDHWHAYLGVNVCGAWQPAVPEFEGRDGSQNPSPQAGIHSHGDFLIHDHPFASDEAGARATLGRYLGYAQSEITEDSIRLWTNWAPGIEKTNGDTCDDSGKRGVVQWKVGRLGEPWPEKARTGNPSDYKMRNGDIIAIYFLPEGSPLEQPPGSDAALSQISDLDGQGALPGVTTTTTTPAPGTETTTPSTPPASDPTSSTTAGTSSTSSP